MKEDKLTLPSLQPVFSVVETKVGVEEPIKETKKQTAAKWCLDNWRALLSELVATSSLLLFGCMAQCVLPDDEPTPALYGPFGFGLTVLMNIQIFGHISGAHMNPAVTLAAVIWGSMSVTLGVFYVIMQCAGATLGFGLLSALVSDPLTPDSMCSTTPREDLNAGQAIGIEIVLTAALGFVNCGVWDPKNRHLQDSIPIKFGLIIVGLSIVGGPLTGASMNPARSLAPAIWNRDWDSHWIYWVGPLLGGGVSAVLYKYIWKPKERSDSPEEEPLDRQRAT